MIDRNTASVTLKVPLWVLEAVKEMSEKEGISIQSLIMQSVIKTITEK